MSRPELCEKTQILDVSNAGARISRGTPPPGLWSDSSCPPPGSDLGAIRDFARWAEPLQTFCAG